ncbi:hypothetical protein [Maliponia aquimaris]|uniref:Lipoprotein n=1 Tax=Maliponia aquimaris TaxID=1673631 RepID=A0A238L499_9RHOB|nr:hypothetical protein [Maliponia aquimaris]SMX49913.1 hypothetical protein MAA8898_04499 [Maliponia aquimaris]
MKLRYAALVPLVLAGCTQPAALPEAGPLTRAAIPDLNAAAPPGPHVVYTHREIAEPMDWRQLNDAQAPGGSS